MTRHILEHATHASVGTTWAALMNIGDHLDSVPGARVAVTRTSSPTVMLSDWTVELRGSPLHWTQRDELDPVAHGIRFRMTTGVLRSVEGSWALEAQDDGRTVVRLVVDFEFGLPNISDVVDPVVGRTYDRIVGALVAGAENPAGQP